MLEEKKVKDATRIRHSRLLTTHIHIKKLKEKSSKRVGVFPIQNTNTLMPLCTYPKKSYSKSPMAKAPIVRESMKRLNVNDIEDMLLGKSGTEDIDLVDYSKLSYDFNSQDNINNDGINRIWTKMLKYTKGEEHDGKLNHFILIQNIKKLIIDSIKKTKPHHELFLDNYNIYKSYCFQTLIIPLIKNKHEKEDDKRIKLLTDIISDKSFHMSLRSIIEEQTASDENSTRLKNSENNRDLLDTVNLDNTVTPRGSQRLIPELQIKAHEDKYLHIKSKVKATLSPLTSSRRK